MATRFQIMVYNPQGKYVQLKVGHGDSIYIDGADTGYTVGKDGYIYKSGSFVSKDTVENVMISVGKLRKKWHSHILWILYRNVEFFNEW